MKLNRQLAKHCATLWLICNLNCYASLLFSFRLWTLRRQHNNVGFMKITSGRIDKWLLICLYRFSLGEAESLGVYRQQARSGSIQHYCWIVLQKEWSYRDMQVIFLYFVTSAELRLWYQPNLKQPIRHQNCPEESQANQFWLMVNAALCTMYDTGKQ